MAKQTKTEQSAGAVEQPVITPADISISESPKAQLTPVEVPAGHVLIKSLNAAGEEIAGSEFFYPERSYQRFYSDESKYLVKKKAN